MVDENKANLCLNVDLMFVDVYGKNGSSYQEREVVQLSAPSETPTLQALQVSIGLLITYWIHYR